MTQKIGGRFKRDSSVDELINLEKNLCLDQAKTFNEFEEKINEIKLSNRAIYTKWIKK